MVLTKQEAIDALQNEIRLILHLASKIEPGMLNYRPSAKQRSLLELMQYFVVVAPVQLEAILAGDFTFENWRARWQPREAEAKAMNFEQTKAAIAKQPEMFAKSIHACPDADLRIEVEMFGRRATRGLFIVRMPLCHLTAYRMQLFLYLKACGLEDLNTMNLWAGVDAARP